MARTADGPPVGAGALAGAGGGAADWAASSTPAATLPRAHRPQLARVSKQLQAAAEALVEAAPQDSLDSVATPASSADRPMRAASELECGSPQQPLGGLLHCILARQGAAQGLLEEDYRLGKVIGEGAFATVRLAEHRRTGARRACKSISKGRLLCAEDVADVVREVEILQLLGGHPHVTTLLGTYEDRTHVHLVMGYCAGGDLFDRIAAQGCFSEAQAARYFRQMVEAVHHCHSLGVIHRDLKLENFLVADASDAAPLVLCDFGLSTFFRPGQIFKERLGTAYYLAPEVLGRRHSAECDLWSLGVALYILLAGAPPFPGLNNHDIFEAIQEGYVDFDCEPICRVSREAKDLIQRLLTPDPAARLTTLQALQHPWLAQNGVAPAEPLHSTVVDRLRAFAQSSKLTKARLCRLAAAMVTARHLTAGQIEGMRLLFAQFDADGDGVITVAELAEGLRRLGDAVSEAELAQVVREADVGHNGGLDYSEFLAAACNHAWLLEEEVVLHTFQALDTTGSGYLTVDELAAAIARMGVAEEADAQAVMEAHGRSRGGLIDYAEFVAMLRGKSGASLRRHCTRQLQQQAYVRHAAWAYEI